jgi:hypothetical protein
MYSTNSHETDYSVHRVGLARHLEHGIDILLVKDINIPMFLEAQLLTSPFLSWEFLLHSSMEKASEKILKEHKVLPRSNVC